MAKLVSKTYGDALFDLCLEENGVDARMEEVQTVRRVFSEHPELTQLLKNPDVGKEEKRDLIETVFKGRVSDDLTGFLRIVIDKQRFGDLDDIWDYFESRVKEYQKIGVANVISPAELSDAWKEQIEKRLLETTGYVKMEMTYEVQPELIGGLVIRIGDTVVDSSIRSKLADIGRRLTRAPLEARKREETI